MSDKCYRYNYHLVSNGIDQFDDDLGSRVEIYHSVYKILKYTPCGFWIEYCNKSGKKFINTKRIKQFAHRNKTDAKVAFKKRKEKQLIIMRMAIENIELSLKMI